MGMAIAGEAICGLGFGTQPLLYTVASEILPRRYRPIAQGGMNVAINMAGAFGLLVGSVIIKEHSEGFRIYWYLSAGLMGVSALVCFLLYNPSPRPLQLSLTLNEKLERLDWVGYFLLVSGIVLFGMALTWSDNPYSWGDAHILAPFVLGLAFLLGLAIHNGFYKRNGLFHHALFKKDRNFALAMLAMFVEGMSFFAANNFFALEMSLLFETDPVRVGLRFSIVFFTAILSASCVATYASAKKDIRTPTVLSFVAFLIFDGQCANTFPSGDIYLCGTNNRTSSHGYRRLEQLNQRLGTPSLSWSWDRWLFSLHSHGGSARLAAGLYCHLKWLDYCYTISWRIDHLAYLQFCIQLAHLQGPTAGRGECSTSVGP